MASFLSTALICERSGFLSTVRPARGLRKTRDCALAAVAEVFVGLGELLCLLFAWKTYRLVVSAVIFAVLCPAALLALSLPGVGGNTHLRFATASLIWLGLAISSFWLAGTYVLCIVAALMVFAFSGLVANRINGWVRPRGGSDWWSSVVRCTFPNFLVLISIAVEAVTLAWSGARARTDSEVRIDGLTSPLEWVALGIVATTLILETLPMVSEEAEQNDLVTSHFWRAATALAREVCFLPVVFVLAPMAANAGVKPWLYRTALLFYSFIALLGVAAWDVDTPYEAFLDIRCTGLNSSGRRLLTMAAVVLGAANGTSSQSVSLAFVFVTICAGVWITAWAPRMASVPWVEILRVGAVAASVAAALDADDFAATNMHATFEWMGSCPSVLVCWCAALALAFAAAVSGYLVRRHRLASSDVPAAVRNLAEMQERLCLWGSTTPWKLHADADVRGTAQRILEFEERIPVERLKFSFFSERSEWRMQLVNAASYTVLLQQIDKLKDNISVPVTRVLLQQVLSRKQASCCRLLGSPLAAQVVQFVVPPIDFKLPPPLKGWEFGKLDLVEMKRFAEKQATEVQSSLNVKPSLAKAVGVRKRSNVSQRQSSQTSLGLSSHTSQGIAPSSAAGGCPFYVQRNAPSSAVSTLELASPPALQQMADELPLVESRDTQHVVGVHSETSTSAATTPSATIIGLQTVVVHGEDALVDDRIPAGQGQESSASIRHGSPSSSLVPKIDEEEKFVSDSDAQQIASVSHSAGLGAEPAAHVQEREKVFSVEAVPAPPSQPASASVALVDEDEANSATMEEVAPGSGGTCARQGELGQSIEMKAELLADASLSVTSVCQQPDADTPAHDTEAAI